jgi:hypothetical protein
MYITEPKSTLAPAPPPPPRITKASSLGDGRVISCGGKTGQGLEGVSYTHPMNVVTYNLLMTRRTNTLRIKGGKTPAS